MPSWRWPERFPEDHPVLLRPRSWCAAVLAATVALLTAGTTGAGTPAAPEVAALIEQLGDPDYAIREAAAARLAALGTDASDALLEAAESHPDVEVAIRARWLVETLPLTFADDPPEVATLLDRFSRGDLDDRVQIMHRLLRLEDDAGIEPLARIVRLERTDAGSRIAAALLAREWQPGEPAWPGLRERIVAGVGASSRATARLLRGLAAATAAASPERAGIDDMAAAVAALDGAEDAEGGVEDPGDAALGREKTQRIFRRCLVELLVTAGRRDAAIVEARRLLAASAASVAREELTAAELAWLTDHGLPEAVDLVADRLDGEIDEPLVVYAAANAWRKRGDPMRAAALAATARKQFRAEGVDVSQRLQAAMLLARWGAADWALVEYRSIIDDPEAPVGEFALAGILGAEFLHEHDRDAEAADLLRRVIEGRSDDDGMEQILMRLERDPRSVRSRMLYFSACAAAARGDAAEERRLVEDSLRSYGKDVDSLIAIYRLSGDSTDRRDDARARITRALEQIEEEIQALPDESNGYNEYAWLVANTEGDIRKATRYSKRSLEQSFDSSSYLDTLAHCRAAAGDFAAAVRMQRLAARQEPHNRAIRRNLERFERMAMSR